MKINEYDEQLDTLVKSTLHEKADRCEVSDGLKEQLDQVIKKREEKMNCRTD